MAKEKQTEPKIVLEREYNVPLRKGWLKVPEYKRASKAVKTLKEFLARHMKVYDRDLRKIKLDIDLNNEIRFRGMRKPPAKIKVKAIKDDLGIVRVSLVNIPEKIKFRQLRELNKKTKIKKKGEEKEEPKKKEEGETGEKKEEESSDKKEKKESAKEETQKIAKKQAKEQKHISKDKRVIPKRKALAK